MFSPKQGLKIIPIVYALLCNSNFIFADDAADQNLGIVQKFFELYDAGDVAGMASVIDDDATWHIPGRHPLSGTKKGLDEILDFFEQLKKVDFQAEVMILEANEKYVIDCHRGWGDFQGDSIDINWVLLYEINDGQITRVQNFSADQYASDAFFQHVYGAGIVPMSPEAYNIIAAVNNVGTFADEHRWLELEALFADSVTLDYTSIVGGEPQYLTPAEITGQWRNFLPGFDLTQHKITDHLLRIDGNHAVVETNVRVLHYIAGVEQGELWIVDGKYMHEFRRIDRNWRITRIQFILDSQSGNTTLPTIAGDRIKN